MAISIHTPMPMKQSDSTIDLSLDYHAHILPGCDHGSDGLKTSLKQVAMARSAGIKTICATPHFYPHRETVASFLKRRQDTYEQLRTGLASDDPCVLLGAEVLICDGMERLDGLHSLCRQDTDELLLEMPFYRWPESIWDTLFQLRERKDIRLVIAHADRYPAEDIERLLQDGILLQLNVDGLRKPLHRKRYLSWIENGYVLYLGSDIHGLDTGYREWIKCKKLLDRRL